MSESTATPSRIPEGMIVPTSLGRLHPSLAIRDLRQAALKWRLWVMLAWQDIRQRYRRTALGPFWLTLSMGISVSIIGTVYGTLMDRDLYEYIPYVALGFIAWGFVSGSLSDGCQAFVQGESIIKQTRLPLSLHVFRVVCRQAIVFAHNAVIYALVLVVFQIWPGWNLLWAIPAILVYAVNALWLVFILGLACARFRDIPPIVGSLIHLTFLSTPIIWHVDQVHKRAILAHANPVFHFIEILRNPMLGHTPPLHSWYVVLCITVGGCLVAFEFFRRYRWRIAYWV